MSEKTAVAIQSMKSAQTEMVQWENRIEAEKSNYNNLKRQSELLQAEIDQKRKDFENYISIQTIQLREGLAKLAEDKKVLESQREEFKNILSSHEKEKQKLAQDRLVVERDKSSVAGQKQLVNDFIQAVRRAYNLIAE